MVAAISAGRGARPVGRLAVRFPGRLAASARNAMGGRADSQEAHSAGGLMVSVAGKRRDRWLCEP
jgi:hypothetical protein